MKLAAIAAVAEGGVIGRDGWLPWRLPADLRHFRTTTMGHHLIVGRRTFEAVGPLPGRTSVVVSRREELDLPEGAVRAASPDAAVELARSHGDEEPFVAGGAAIYRELLPRVERLYLTRVHASVEGDVRFPEIDPEQWRELSRREHPADRDNPYAMTFSVFERVG